MFELSLLYINMLLPVFTPWTNNTTGSALHNLILIFLCSFNLLLSKKYKLIKKNFIFYLNIFYIFMIFTGICISLEYFIIRDFFEFQRPIFYILAFFTGQLYFYKKKSKDIIKDLKIFFLIIIIISLIKVIDPDNSFFYLYQRKALAAQVRLSGTFISPYDFGFFLLFPLYFYLELYFKNKKIIYIFLSVIIFSLIIFTESKSQIITLLFSIIIYITVKFILNKKESIKIIKYLIFLAIITYFGINIFKEEVMRRIPYLYFGLKKIIEGGIQNDPSGNIRFNQYLKAFETFRFLGYGPAKGKGLDFENQYSLYLYRYGILGIAYNLILILGIFKLNFIMIKKYRNIEMKAIVVTFIVFTFSLPIAMLANNMTDQLKISFFIYFILGLIINLERRTKK